MIIGTDDFDQMREATEVGRQVVAEIEQQILMRQLFKLVGNQQRGFAGERGIGIPDPGATAYLRFLEAMRESLTDQLPTDPDEGEAQ